MAILASAGLVKGDRLSRRVTWGTLGVSDPLVQSAAGHGSAELELAEPKRAHKERPGGGAGLVRLYIGSLLLVFQAGRYASTF
jgi:hypothetical protein